MELDRKYFNLLKEEIVETLSKTYPEINKDIESWKGHEIALFQEELIKKVNSRVSEKWFYTHIKGKQDDIPRIDMLNLLSQFCGYQNWTDFKSKNKIRVFNSSIFRNKWVTIAGVLVISLLSVYIYSSSTKKKKYTFCFRDAYTNQPVSRDQIQFYIVSKKESPLLVDGDRKCCFKVESPYKSIRFLPVSHYYRTDTLRRILDRSEKTETILLQPNDFSIMWNLMANSDTTEWLERKEMLRESFSPQARIYEVSSNQLVGMELYNREEFVDKISLPIYSLKNMLIVDVQYENDKIKVLRFKQDKR